MLCFAKRKFKSVRPRLIKKTLRKITTQTEVHSVAGHAFLQEGKYDAHVYRNRVNLNVEGSFNYV